MKYSQICDCCGNKVTAYTHNLNKYMIDGLVQLVRYWRDHKKPANLQKDLDLTKNQYNNFQKLQYFGLVENTTGWKPTFYGEAFVNGIAPCYTSVATFGKITLDINHPAWQTCKSLPKRLMIWEFDSQYKYKQKNEYQEEKGTVNLFSF